MWVNWESAWVFVVKKIFYCPYLSTDGVIVLIFHSHAKVQISVSDTFANEEENKGSGGDGWLE